MATAALVAALRTALANGWEADGTYQIGDGPAEYRWVHPATERKVAYDTGTRMLGIVMEPRKGIAQPGRSATVEVASVGEALRVIDALRVFTTS